MQKLNLPNNLEIYCFGKEETEYIYREIFIEQQYLQHGITINDGDCIIDVGANIGLFSIFLSKLHKSLKILAFEPVQPIFEVLQANVNLHSLDNISLQNYGLGSENISETVFTFYPNMAGNSTTRPWEKLYHRELMNAAVNQEMVEYFFQSQEIIRWVNEKRCEKKNLVSGCFTLTNLPHLFSFTRKTSICKPKFFKFNPQQILFIDFSIFLNFILETLFFITKTRS